jgi:redox-sensing transcriptional repressor
MSDIGVDGRTSPTPLRVPEPTVERLSTYLQFLYSAAASGLTTISSAHVESATAVSAAQFRKDLSYFGEFGKPGVGYVIAELQSRISRILQLHETQPVILIGLGNLGAALLSYPGLTEQRFQVVAAFDIDPNK